MGLTGQLYPTALKCRLISGIAKVIDLNPREAEMIVLFPAARQIGEVREDIDCAVAKSFLWRYPHHLHSLAHTEPARRELHSFYDESG